MHFLAYGTLRDDARLRSLGIADKVHRSGVQYISGTMYDVGAFPGVIMDGKHLVKCEKFTFDDPEVLRILDEYEGYDQSDLSWSLFVRRQIGDGYVYEFNRSADRCPLVTSGDWMQYNEQRTTH